MKTSFYFAFLLFSLIGNSQTDKSLYIKNLSRKNEIRIDVSKIVENQRLGLSYERFLNKRFSVGISTLFFEDNTRIDDYKNKIRVKSINEYQIIPYTRYSFMRNYKSNWYGELFYSINGGKYKRFERLTDGTIGYYQESQKRYNDIALGASVGLKIYIKKRFAIDLHFGLAGNIDNAVNETPEVITRFGINFGYRF